MEEFVKEYPKVVVSLVGVLIAYIIHLTKQNESKGMKDLASKFEMVAKEIKGLAEQIVVLYKKDNAKENRMDDLANRVSVQERRCSDREKSCPGHRIQKLMDGNIYGRRWYDPICDEEVGVRKHQPPPKLSPDE